MKQLTFIAAALAVGLGPCAPAAANNSSAELAAGGLVLTRPDAIEMRSEDLYISAKAVRVRYRFANTGTRDVTVTVAFPMPDITTVGFDDMLAVPTQDPANFLAFATLVDGTAGEGPAGAEGAEGRRRPHRLSARPGPAAGPAPGLDQPGPRPPAARPARTSWSAWAWRSSTTTTPARAWSTTWTPPGP